jgi:hypothetical protein
MGLSCYLILIGIYYSAVTVAQDSKLRQSVRKFALKELQLLDSIGTAQMEKEIEEKVIMMTRQTQYMMVQETGVHPSLEEIDVKNIYMK